MACEVCQAAWSRGSCHNPARPGSPGSIGLRLHLCPKVGLAYLIKTLDKGCQTFAIHAPKVFPTPSQLFRRMSHRLDHQFDRVLNCVCSSRYRETLRGLLSYQHTPALWKVRAAHLISRFLLRLLALRPGLTMRYISGITWRLLGSALRRICGASARALGVGLGARMRHVCEESNQI